MAGSDTTIGFWFNEKRLIIVETRVSDRSITLIKSVDADMPQGLIEKGHIEDFDGLCAFSKEVLKSIKPTTKFASINLPPGSYQLKRFQLPEEYITADTEIPYFELKNQLLQDETRYKFSHFVMGQQVYMIAALRSHMDQGLKLLTSIGLVPVSSEPPEISLHNIFRFITDDWLLSALLLEVSTPYSTVALIKDGVFYPGGKIVTGSDLYLSACKSTIQPVNIDQFIEDLKQKMDSVFAPAGFKTGSTPPSALVLSGIYPNLALAMEIENLVDSPIYLADGIKKQKRVKKKGKHQNITFPEMLSALGLALRRPHD